MFIVLHLVKMSYSWRIIATNFCQAFTVGCPKCFICITLSDEILTTVGISIPHLTNEETEVERGYVIHPRSHC